MAKLRARTAMDHDRRHYKAAKALVIIIPLLGFTYLLTFIGPSKESNPLAYTVFQSVRAVLLSTQGGVITLPYCYLNTEVQGVIRTRWDRWQMVRNVEYASHSTRTSLATSTIYYTQVEIPPLPASHGHLLSHLSLVLLSSQLYFKCQV